MTATAHNKCWENIKSNRSLNQTLPFSSPSPKTLSNFLKPSQSKDVRKLNTKFQETSQKTTIECRSSCESGKQTKKQERKPRLQGHIYSKAEGKALPRQCRYFPAKDFIVDPKEAASIGLCETMNRYGERQVSSEMKNLSPTIQRKELGLVKVCRQNELFLTRPKHMSQMGLDQFLKEEFVANEPKSIRFSNNEELSALKGAPAEQIARKSYRQQIKDRLLEAALMEPPQETVEDICNTITEDSKNFCFLEVKNFKLERNEAFVRFKLEHIEVWDELSCLLNQIQAHLKEIKIGSCTFKASALLQYWTGKRLSEKDFETILKVKRTAKKTDVVKNVMKLYYAKKTIREVNWRRQRRLGLIKWVSDRMKGIALIRKEKEYKIQKAYEIHDSLLRGEYTWDVEIYISSFSEDEFLRNTTQYMESFESMFTHMWQESSKPMVLVLPTLNSEILQLYQEKLKVKRAVTIICPEMHPLFPVNMSLAGNLLFSYEALNRIRKIIEGRKAVIVPGKFSDPKYELLISEFLRAPLLTSLRPERTVQSQKQLLLNSKLAVLPYSIIPAESQQKQVITKFAQLILKHRNIHNWIFKINSQFGSRGLATFNMQSSKLLRSVLSSCKNSSEPLQEYLSKNLKLRLKVSFENCLFILGDYVQRLCLKGGVIEEQKEPSCVENFQLSFSIHNQSCNLLSCFRGFGVNFSNKVYIYESTLDQKISKHLPSLKNNLQASKYIGHVSVSLMIENETVYGVEIKPWLTHLASIEPFIRSIETKRQMKLIFDAERSNSTSQRQQIASSSLRGEAIDYRRQMFANAQIGNKLKNFREELNSEIADEQPVNSRVSSHLNISMNSEFPTIRNRVDNFDYLYIPNVILSDVSVPKKAALIEDLIEETWRFRKFDILDRNILQISNGLSLSLLVVGKDIKRMKKDCIEMVRTINEKVSAVRSYCGKNETRDIFQFGDLIKAITQIGAAGALSRPS